jgi:hypothetical protein
VSRILKTGKKAVELRPSRIRRDPPARAAEKAEEVRWQTSEREIKLAILGIVLFAIAINIIILGISAYWA